MESYPKFTIEKGVNDDHRLPFVNVTGEFIISQLNSPVFLEGYRQNLIRIQTGRLAVIAKTYPDIGAPPKLPPAVPQVPSREQLLGTRPATGSKEALEQLLGFQTPSIRRQIDIEPPKMSATEAIRSALTGVDETKIDREREAVNKKIKAQYYRIHDRITKNLQELADPNYIRVLQQNLYQAIVDPENGVESIIGDSRLSIRRDLYTMIYSIGRGYPAFLNVYSNYIITGDPGSGKNKVSSVIAFFYSKIGILGNPEPKLVTRTDLVGAYIGVSERQTRDILVESLDRVLIIDEAYAIYRPGSTNDYGQQVINEIVFFLDKHLDFLSIHALGYRDQMIEKFLGANPGMDRRFPNKIHLEPYITTDLVKILKKFTGLNESQEITDLYTYFIQTLMGYFNNQSGDMQNLAARIKEDHFLGVGSYSERHIIAKSFQDFMFSKGITLRFDSGSL